MFFVSSFKVLICFTNIKCITIALKFVQFSAFIKSWRRFREVGFRLASNRFSTITIYKRTDTPKKQKNYCASIVYYLISIVYYVISIT